MKPGDVCRKGRLYRARETSTVFEPGSIVKLVVDDGTDSPGFTVLFGAVRPEYTWTYIAESCYYRGPFLYEEISCLELLEKP